MKKVGKKLLSLLMVTLICVTCSGCGIIRFYQNIGEAVLGQFKQTPRHEETLAEAFICDSGADQVLVINYNGKNNCDEAQNGYNFSSDFNVTLDGTALNTAYLSSSNPYAIDIDKDIPSGSEDLLQETYLLPAGSTAGDLHIEANSYSMNYKKTIKVMEEDLRLEELEKKVTESSFSLAIQGAVLTDDGEGTNLLIVDYIYSNASTESYSFGSSLNTKAYQNGIELQTGWLPYNHPLVDDSLSENTYTEVKPGNSLTVRVIYELNDPTTPVNIESTDYYSYNNAEVLNKQIAIDATNVPIDSIVATTTDTSSSFSFRIDAAIIGLSEYYNDPAVFMVGEFTNNSDKAMSFSSVVDVVATQGNYSLSKSYISGVDSLNYNDIAPGATIPIIIGFELMDLTNSVTITATDSTHYANETLYFNTYTIDQLIQTTKTYIDRYNILQGEIYDGYQF